MGVEGGHTQNEPPNRSFLRCPQVWVQFIDDDLRDE